MMLRAVLVPWAQISLQKVLGGDFTLGLALKF